MLYVSFQGFINSIPFTNYFLIKPFFNLLNSNPLKISNNDIRTILFEVVLIILSSNPENKAFKEDIEGWAKIAEKIYIWHYVGNRNHYLLPNAELDTLVPNMRFFAENKCTGVFNQGTHVGASTDMTMLKQWVLAKSLWNPQADGRKLIEEYRKRIADLESSREGD